MALLTIRRFNYGPEKPTNVTGTFGVATLPSGRELYSVEPPWVGNQVSISCIPEGVYKLGWRRSGVVERSTKGEFLEGWEVLGVPGRSLIMLHPGNWPHNFEGCIGFGLKYGLLGDKLAVFSSRDAFRLMMAEFPKDEDHEIHIMPYLVEFP
ncbi:DUF5675 family protein [Marinobacter nauticus]|uniref:DUF5675 domain-containing protein n=1 Tax=Marinobacter nauticus TaxID=2743 RepID=A0A833JU49_MARNT|nr:DUF5675 family protein [Marinobacter nauticus]KAE8546135.1 hypothetical protein F6453_1381 [Marinobacter nauticus]